jgi:hypothetical protein
MQELFDDEYVHGWVRAQLDTTNLAYRYTPVYAYNKKQSNKPILLIISPQTKFMSA